MRRLCLPLILCAVFLSVLATPAHAISWEFINDLSGPGPFYGFENEARVWCFGGEPPPEVSTKVVGGVKWGCLSGTKLKHKGPINFTAAYDFGQKNNLSYEPPKVGKRVDILRLGPSIEWALRDRTVEVSAGVEWDHFLGSGFGNFSRLAVPLIVDLKPFVTDRTDTSNKLANIVTVQFGVLIIPSAFDSARDFGASPGSFHTFFEVLPTVGLVFDLGHRE